MHHITLNRPRAYYGDLNNKVIVGARLQARQHVHLRARLHLKHTHGVTLGEHRVDLWILKRNILQTPAFSVTFTHHAQCALNSTEHTERQHIDLQQS